MKNLETYVVAKNKWNALFGDTNPITFPLSQSNVNALMDSIESELSPENLHCDGEAPIAYVRSKLKQLNTVQAELETYCLDNWLETPHSMDNAY
mgnify:FL=1|jgi:hypothetical protein